MKRGLTEGVSGSTFGSAMARAFARGFPPCHGWLGPVQCFAQTACPGPPSLTSCQ